MAKLILNKTNPISNSMKVVLTKKVLLGDMEVEKDSGQVQFEDTEHRINVLHGVGIYDAQVNEDKLEVRELTEEVRAAHEHIHADKASVETSEANALTYARAADEAATDSENSAATSAIYSEQSLASANKAKTSETNAKTSETKALASEVAAKTSELNADTSEGKALDSERAAKASEIESASSASTASTQAGIATTKAAESLASANKAKVSETNAKTSETKAKVSETNAKASEVEAGEQMELATEQAVISTTKANEAAASATRSATSASQSSTYASNSSDSADDSATSASESANHASNSADSASESAAHAAKSKTSETNAKTSETNSKASEVAAANSAADALDSANKAKVSETNSKTFETNSSNSASASATSASKAKVSETNSKTSEAKAKTSETNSKASEVAAKASETKAKTSEVAALDSEEAAAASASTATTKANQAAASASNASTSSNHAAASAAEALDSEEAALSSKNAAAASASTATTKANQAAASASNASTSSNHAQSSEEAAESFAIRAENAAATLTGALVEAGNVDLSIGKYPNPIVDVNGTKRACFWKVVKGGTVSGVDYGVGDSLVYSAETNGFYKIDNTESVTSVDGRKGIVTLSDKYAVKSIEGVVATKADKTSVYTKVESDGRFLGKTANAVSATKLATTRTIALSGDATGSVAFDGTKNVTIPVVVNNNSHTHVLSNITDINTHVPEKAVDLGSSIINDMKTSAHAGFYFQDSNADALTSRGYPEQAAGSLLIQIAASGVTQAYTIYNTGKVWTRAYYGSAWSIWRRHYDTVDKPSKTDVGLSSVNNWGATAAINDSSDSKYATAGAVKKAYDLAASKITKAQADGYYLGKTSKAADSSKLNGISNSTDATANTIVQRDSSGDVNARLLRSNYANQTNISGAIAFRINNSSDNYTRYCSDMGAVRTFVGVYSKAETDTRVNAKLSLSGGSLTGNLTVKTATISTSITNTDDNAPIRMAAGSTGNTAGTYFMPLTQQTCRHGQGYSTHVTTGLVKNGYGSSWGEGVSGFFVGTGGNDGSPTEYFTLAYGGKIKHSRGHEFYSTAFKPSAGDVGAYTKAESDGRFLGKTAKAVSAVTADKIGSVLAANVFSTSHKPTTSEVDGIIDLGTF